MLNRNLISTPDGSNYGARADRSIQSARVLVADTVSGESILDVGMVNADGGAVYMVGANFSPQNPPHSQDIVPLLRTNSSPYSMTIGGGAQIGGANSGQVVSNGGVMSVAKSGSTKLKDDVTMSATGGAVLTQAGQDIEIDAGMPTGGSTGQALIKASGADYNVAWGAPTAVKTHLLTLSLGTTPPGTGVQDVMFPVPYDSDGTTVVTWNVKRAVFRVHTAGGAPVVVLGISTGTGAQSADGTITTLTMVSGAYEVSVTTSLGTVQSGWKIYLNVTTLGTAVGWTITLLLSNA